MKKTGILLILMFTFAFTFLQAQSTGTGSSSLTIEEMYLQRQQTVEAFNRLSRTSDVKTRVVVLNELERMYMDGKLTSQDEDYIAILDYLALDGTTIIAREGSKVSHSYPEVRMLACRLLAKIGGPQAGRTLKAVTMNDAEPTVLAEAVYGLGVMGDNKEEKISSLIAYTVTKWDILKPDNTLAFASLLAIEKIAVKNNGIFDPEVLRAVIRLSLPEGGYVKEVKEKAIEVFRLLRTFM